MAEKVQIRGGELDGSQLENAATEATLLRLVEAFEKKNGLGTGGRVQDAFTRSLGMATKSSTALGESFDRTRASATRLSGGLMGFATKGLSTVLAGATFAVRSFADFLTASFSNYRSIADTGVTFGNNMVEVSRVALNAGMGMQEFTDMIKRNSSSIMALGGTASQGAQRLADLRKGIIDSDIGTRLFGLGLTTRDVEDFMGSYLEQQQRFSNLQRRDNASLTQGVAAYVEELDKVSKLTGIERKRLDEQARRISADPVFNALRANLSTTARAVSDANLALVAEAGGPELESALKEIATGVIESDLAKELTRVGAISREQALGIAQGTMQASEVLGSAARVLQQQSAYGTAYLLQGNRQLAAGATAAGQLNRFIGANTEAARREQQQRNALTEAFGKIPAVFTSVRNRIFGAIVSSNAFDRIVQTLNTAAGQLNSAIEPFIRYFTALAEGFSQIQGQHGFAAALRAVITTLGRDLKEIFLPGLLRNLNELFGTQDIRQDIGNFIKDGFESLIAAALRGIGNVIRGMLSGRNGAQPTEGQNAQGAQQQGSAGGGGDGGFLSTLQPIISALERMALILGVGAAGAIIAGVGITVAISALGAALTKAAPGALAFAGAILIGGTGLKFALEALATVINSVSNAFDQVGNFIDRMGQQDAGNLDSVGRALGPMADALVKMGGAGVLALIGGNGLNNLGDALGKIQALNPSSIEAVAPALERLHQALSLYTGGGRGQGILESLGGAIARFFAGDNGIGRFAGAFQRFNNIDGDNIKNVASGLQELRSSIGQEFTEQARTIDTYAGSIRVLTNNLVALKTAMDNLQSSRRGGFTLTDLASAAGGGPATNALVEEQRKLNSMIEALKPVFEETRDNTKNTADSIGGRRRVTD